MAISILVIDDDSNIRSALARILRPQGFLVTVVDGGFSAREWLTKINPHLITLDISMPEMDGIEVLSMIRSLSNLQDTKILILSGHPKLDLIPLLDYGADDIMEKPVKPNILIQKIKTMVG